MIIQSAGDRGGTEFGLSPLDTKALSARKAPSAFSKPMGGLKARTSHLCGGFFLLEPSPQGAQHGTMPKMLRHWLVKQEPTAYSWEDFVADGRTAWTGVRNFQARIHLRSMKEGDQVLFYHSVVGKEVVGVAKVSAEAYADPTTSDGEWVCVDLVPVRPLVQPISLAQIKASPKLKDIGLVRQSRLSVVPLTAEEFEEIVRLSAQK